MARLAVANGIERMVCTPHIQPGRFNNSVETIASAYQQFVDALAAENITLQVSFAAEVHFGLEVMQAVKAHRLPYLGQWEGKHVLLLEFPHSDLPVGAEQLTKWLLANNVVPMIAHPERNRGIIRAPSRLKAFLEQGCLLQLTASSLTGRFGRGAQQLAEEILTQGKATVLASDAHDLEHRPPALHEGVQIASRLIGETAAQALVTENPRQITEHLFR